MTWLVFYPKTMWRIVAQPTGMMHYSDAEQGDIPDEQHIDTLDLRHVRTVTIKHRPALLLRAR